MRIMVLHAVTRTARRARLLFQYPRTYQVRMRSGGPKEPPSKESPPKESPPKESPPKDSPSSASSEQQTTPKQEHEAFDLSSKIGPDKPFLDNVEALFHERPSHITPAWHAAEFLRALIPPAILLLGCIYLQAEAEDLYRTRDLMEMEILRREREREAERVRAPLEAEMTTLLASIQKLAERIERTEKVLSFVTGVPTPSVAIYTEESDDENESEQSTAAPVHSDDDEPSEQAEQVRETWSSWAYNYFSSWTSVFQSNQDEEEVDISIAQPNDASPSESS